LNSEQPGPVKIVFLEKERNLCSSSQEQTLSLFSTMYLKFYRPLDQVHKCWEEDDQPQILNSLPERDLNVWFLPVEESLQACGILQEHYPMSLPVASNIDAQHRSSASLSASVSEIDRYVDKVLKETKPLPTVTWRSLHKEIRWFNFSIIVFFPLVALYGIFTTKLLQPTFAFATLYYVFSMFGTPS
jgi:hypothetical protein